MEKYRFKKYLFIIISYSLIFKQVKQVKRYIRHIRANNVNQAKLFQLLLATKNLRTEIIQNS